MQCWIVVNASLISKNKNLARVGEDGMTVNRPPAVCEHVDVKSSLKNVKLKIKKLYFCHKPLRQQQRQTDTRIVQRMDFWRGHDTVTESN